MMNILEIKPAQLIMKKENIYKPNPNIWSIMALSVSLLR